MTTSGFAGKFPAIGSNGFIAPTAVVIGDVVIGDESSVWYGAVVRGDVHRIRIGSRTNLQDHCVVHVSGGTHPTSIGDEVTVGHAAVVHGCQVGSGSLIGIGAIVLDGVEIGDECLVAAGSLLPPGKAYPPRSLIVGAPARVGRALEPEEIAALRSSAAKYVELAAAHRRNGVA